MSCPNCLDCNNPCNECQQNIPVTPEPYTPSLPDCIDGCEFPVFTNCVLTSDQYELCGVDYPKNTPLSTLLADIIAGMCCNCVSCDTVTSDISLEMLNVIKSNNQFDTLLSKYVTFNDKIVGLYIQDNSSSTDTVNSLKYNIPLWKGYKHLTNSDLSTTLTMSVDFCPKHFLNQDVEVFADMMTSRGCYLHEQGFGSMYKVLYSERIAEPYRFNAQINDNPVFRDYTVDESVDKGILYLADTLTNSGVTNGNYGSVIRKVNLNTRDITTISGVKTTSGNFPTINGMNGSKVLYGRASSIIIDRKEMYNDEPVLYFVTYGTQSNSGLGISEKGGVVCRLVKESNCNECDERVNWTTHVLANLNNEYGYNIDPASPISGSNIQLKHLYGLKRWFDVNGAPSFYIYDASQPALYYMYHTGDGSMNSADNWMFQKVNLPSSISYENLETGQTLTYPLTLGGVSSNINVDDYSDNSKKLILTTEQGIYEFKWNGASTPTISESSTLIGIDWDKQVVVYNNSTCLTSAEVNGLFDQISNSNTVTIYNPNFVYRNQNSNSYLYGTGRIGVSLKTAIRMYENTGTTTYNHNTSVLELNPTGIVSATTIRQSIGNSTSSTSMINGLSEGFVNDLQGNLYDLTYGGVRLWSDDLSTCDVYIGQDSSTSTELQQALASAPSITYRMDTQYGINLTV